MEIESFVTHGIGDSSYLIASQGEAIVVDPQRDAWRFLSVAEQRGWTIRYVLETHVHNDYVSGALEIRAATGATLVVPEDGRYRFPHEPAREGSRLQLGDIELAAMHTPGHTPEHLAWAVMRDDHLAGIFSGGSLLVGSTGRSDLLGEAGAAALARAQYGSVRRLAALPAETALWPTHGAGSFCIGAMWSTARTSTIGAERAHNPALHARFDDYLSHLAAAANLFPTYFRSTQAINRKGPAVLGRFPAAPMVGVLDVADAVSAGAWIIDARDRDAFAAAHVPGSVNVELNEAFGTYVGWIVPRGAPVFLILPEPLEEASAEALTQLVRIGYEQVAGILADGIEGWQVAGQPTRSYPTAAMRDLYEEHSRQQGQVAILDVRQPIEWRDDGTIPGSQQIFVADLPGRLKELTADDEHWVVCTSGHRSAIAASLLDRAGIPARLVSRGGTVGWIERFEARAA